jgi:hypothetical protein
MNTTIESQPNKFGDYEITPTLLSPLENPSETIRYATSAATSDVPIVEPLPHRSDNVPPLFL